MSKITIYHDFNLDLKLYSIPNFFIDQIKKEFANVSFKDIDFEDDKNKIYLGADSSNKSQSQGTFSRSKSPGYKSNDENSSSNRNDSLS